MPTSTLIGVLGRDGFSEYCLANSVSSIRQNKSRENAPAHEFSRRGQCFSGNCSSASNSPLD
jgi:hypothetical protein